MFSRLPKGVSLILLGVLFIAIPLTVFFSQKRQQIKQRAAPTVTTNFTQYVNPFIGTTHGANMWPDALYPMGMVQWGPDTITNPDGGYLYDDTTIKDFSLTHFSGRGCSYLQDFPFIPYVGSVTTSPVSNPSLYYSTFSHTNESARPGYYKVHLDSQNIYVELTATARTGYGQFTYPTSANSTMIINTGGSINGKNGNVVSSVNIVGNNQVTGSVNVNIGCGIGGKVTTYFSAQFDQPFTKAGTWNDATVTNGSTSSNGKFTGAIVTFDTTTNRVVHVKVGLSYVSIANAQANIQAENPGNDFQAVATNTLNTWNSKLSSIQVRGGTNDEKVNLYTALYHALIHPNIFNDANGQYLGFDNKVHTLPPGHNQYENISTWDQYRSHAQLLAMLYPAETSDILQSFVNDAQQGDGHLPRWEQTNLDSYGMSGDGADAYIASAHALGATDFDTKSALQFMISGQPITREGYNDYVSLGYVPVGITPKNGGANVSASMTLEYGNNDFALSQFARALGDTNSCNTYWQRSNNWQNLFNPTSKFIQPRMRDGTWMAGFDPTIHNNGFHEGNSLDYTWMVQGHLPVLFDKMGGKPAAVQRLNSFYNGSGKIGNEQLFEIPWEYNFAGNPSGTQNIVRNTQLNKFSNAPGGYPGNDDGGGISSWYLLSIMGLYSEVPGVGGLTIGSPLFNSTTVRLGNGKTLQINAPAASDNAPYVQSLSVNGQAATSPWVNWSTLQNGATLDFVLGANPSTWGASNPPPTFDTAASACSQIGSTPPPPTPSSITPTYFCLAGQQCTSPNPTVSSVPITSDSPTPSSSLTSSPNPQPCTVSSAADAEESQHKKHRSHRHGGTRGLINQLLRLIIELLNLLIRLLGGNPIILPPVPTPTPTPGIELSPTPNPTDSPNPSVSPCPSLSPQALASPTSDITGSPTSNPTGSQTGGFITLSGQNFTKDGTIIHPYGSTIYHTPWRDATKFNSYITSILDMAQQARLNTVRVTDFLEGTSDPYDPTVWSNIDSLFSATASRNIYVILSLSTYRNMLKKQGVYQYDIAQWKQFLTFVGNRYKNQSNLINYGIAGEVPCPNGSDTNRPTSTAGLTTFYQSASDLLHSTDPNHLITSGGFLHLNDPTCGIDWQAINSLPNMNLLSIHVYSTNDQTITVPMVSQWAKAHNKPFTIEEFGFKQSDTDQTRANEYQAIYNLAKQYNATTIIFWNLANELATPTHDAYGVNPQTPLTWKTVITNAP